MLVFYVTVNLAFIVSHFVVDYVIFSAKPANILIRIWTGAEA